MSSFSISVCLIGVLFVTCCCEAKLSASARCKAPQISGPCKAYFPGWSFDGKSCKQFVYGGCLGNSNRFKTREECYAACGMSRLSKILRMRSPPPGTGQQYGEDYTEDEPIIDNNAQDYLNIGDESGLEYPILPLENTDYRSAVETAKSAQCDAPIDVGECLAYFPRWGFDGSTCVKFIYGGCRGNSNNFMSREECKAACRSSGVETETGQYGDNGYESDPMNLNPIQRPSLTEEPIINKYPFPRPTNTEEPINKYPSQGPTINEDPINKYPFPRPTFTEEPINKYPIPRPAITEKPWIQNPIQNPTMTEEPINKYPISNVKTEMCTEKIEDLPIGYINGLVQTKFMRVWSCTADSRIFQGHDECERNCKDRPEFCSLPEDPGRCRAYMPLWFWDQKTKNCRPFGYGGCGGNKNKFGTEEHCLKICGEDTKEPEPVCPSFATGNVRHGYWKCLLDNKDVLFNTFPYNVDCLLYCDGDDLYSYEQVICRGGKWIRAGHMKNYFEVTTTEINELSSSTCKKDRKTMGNNNI